MFEIIYKNGTNEIICFPEKKHVEEWLETMYKLGNRKRGSVVEIKTIQQ